MRGLRLQPPRRYDFPMALYIGTSGWSYPSWKPAFFPEGLPQKRFLEFYGTRFNAVELNATFRRFTPASSLTNWMAGTPPDFRFAAKAHQVITHFRRLKDVAEPVRSFLESMEPMRQAGKLGPILFQVPPNLKADALLLEEFVQLLPAAYRFAFEARHPSWFSDAIFEILKKKNVALCWAESEKIGTPNVVTSDFLYYRFRQPEYSREQLDAMAEQLKSQVEERDVFAFFKHEETPEGALNAAKIARLFGMEEKPFVLPARKPRRQV